MHRRLNSLACAAIVLTLFAGQLLGAAPVAADAPDPAFQATWARTDQPVASGAVARTWMWGPQANTPAIPEPYTEAPDGVRNVQYYDKARMEITHPDGDPGSIWYVTNGLLVVELLTGRMQTGDNAFVPRRPAQINVAGDADDPNGPTYATFAGLTNAAPAAAGAQLTQRVDRAGHVTDDPGLAQHGVTAAQRVQVPGIDHQIASPFWTFMTSSGLVYQDGANTTANLFVDPFYATGYPLTEAYWASVRVGGTVRDVLMQCFERRCLTYTPGNPAGFETEAGNVGQHYHAWRYDDTGNGGGGDDGGGETAQLQVVAVVDGNEILVRANGYDFHVRYLGIQDPEGDECYAAEAAQRNRDLVLGQTITMVRDITNSDWYGTLPRYVYVGDMFINLELVREGYARAIDVKNDPNIAHKAELLAAQAEAQAAGRGLWGACG
jgi:endonuclease YncB( thermonuclease family)